MSDSTKQVLCHKDLGLGLTCTNANQRVYFPTIAKRAIATKIRAESISEELRVLYVAMTRARDRLIMTYAVKNLENQLSDIALKLDLCKRELLTAYVSCPGDWVLISALQRTEAGELFNLSVKPDCSCVQKIPWSIHIAKTDKSETAVSGIDVENIELSREVVEKMKNGLKFSYTHALSVSIPSKMTATQLKGRFKDQEAAEFSAASDQKILDFRSPTRLHPSIRGTQYGNAMHYVMQYLDFQCCSDLHSLQADIDRMLTSGLITKEQAAAIDLKRILRFFQTDMGQRIVNGKEVLREFKFSILEDSANYYDNVQGEQILLQGVIDCALIESDGITVLDFKTDFISDKNFEEKVSLYTQQVRTYANALSKIYEMPVNAAYIYFFSTEQFVRIQ